MSNKHTKHIAHRIAYRFESLLASGAVSCELLVCSVLVIYLLRFCFCLTLDTHKKREKNETWLQMGMSTLQILPQKTAINWNEFMHAFFACLLSRSVFFVLSLLRRIFLGERVELDNGSNSPLEFWLIGVPWDEWSHFIFMVRMQMKLCAVAFATVVAILWLLLMMFVSVKHFMYFRLDHHACGTVFGYSKTNTGVCMSQNDFAEFSPNERYVLSVRNTHSFTILFSTLFLLYFLWNVYYFALSLLFFIVDSSLNHVRVVVVGVAFLRLMMWSLDA